MNTATPEELERLLRLGVALSAERNLPRLLCRILAEAQAMTDADGGTLYLLSEDEAALEFAIIRNRSLGIAINACGEVNERFAPVPLQDAEGRPNHRQVAAHVALVGKSVVIDDVYGEHPYDLAGVRRFDARHGYRTRSLLTVPMRDHEETVIGVLQLVNRLDAGHRTPVPFRVRDLLLAEALASQAAVALANRRLIQGLEDFIDAFVRVIATAIDEKNPHTANHCKRVPALTLMLAEAAARTEQGPLAEFRLTDRDRREIELAAWLHDCGKIATPEYILDKATKLHTLYDRIGVIDTRFAVLRQQVECAYLQALANPEVAGDEMARRRLQQEKAARLAELEEERRFLHRCNLGTETMDEADRERVRRIARRRWKDATGAERPLLEPEEVECLTIPRGTLTPREREIINNHIVVTQRMLEQLPFPRHLRNIPEYAGGHHERVDGRGYPRGLTREQLSIPARILAIADVFEALTDRDRPYKTGKTVSEALDILREMCEDGHIDPDLFEVFLREQVYLEYARRYLPPEQVDLDEATAVAGAVRKPRG
ncbi:MAG: GAF domain-containing protein [Gammaproteobacteria bacterium]|nr:MAG: GAF domain-containing protein [Gammaproteobacteria bacterium]